MTRRKLRVHQGTKYCGDPKDLNDEWTTLRDTGRWVNDLMSKISVLEGQDPSEEASDRGK